ncbi:c-type cytochrome [Blastopirellula sp. JC732]|uniref:Methylamine utilization protein MauG n=1 Tax=Blastopirellula sediminis TaxID=2894196 RepID=A0A9X1MP53_9BACT|nr:cytochrome c peroxidase [Blastopirellula sediminis]MCC9607225.1 c-type cytochrome [Blastopirellula sediminis]MCC9629482.1 c-type cytochrome [Blastopirellula sediminis]
MKRLLTGALAIALIAGSTTLFADKPAAKSNKVTLGDPSLTAGIPGEGPLEVADIEKYLADPANSETLEVELPYGIAAQAGNITGLDKNPMTRAKIELGRQLYFDKRLSVDQTVSCADCHHPNHGWAKETQFGVGVLGQEGNRNSPVSFNRILSGPQFWDGRAATLEDQAIGPIANPIEMGFTHDACVADLNKIPGYKLEFKKVFGDDNITIENVGKAIATFERAVVTGPAPYDYYEVQRTFENQLGDDIKFLKEDDPDLYEKYAAAVKGAKEMSQSARRGREIFFSEKGKCTACHAGANFTDELYHNLGVGMDVEKPDLGRYEITKEEKDKGAFKTPTLRNIAQTGPYMHDGSQKTLMEVVEWYAKGGHPNPYLSDKVKKLDLTEQDKKDLVAFMEALTGDFPTVETSRLPK